MYRFKAAMLIMLAFLIGCASNVEPFQGPIDSFQGQIEEVGESSYIVDCSDEMNKGKGDNVNSIGYGCTVHYSDETAFYDTDGKSLSIDKFLPGSEVKVILTKPVDIRRNKESKQQKTLVSKEIVLIEAAK